jgi:hypothetical protein
MATSTPRTEEELQVLRAIAAVAALRRALELIAERRAASN